MSEQKNSLRTKVNVYPIVQLGAVSQKCIMISIVS